MISPEIGVFLVETMSKKLQLKDSHLFQCFPVTLFIIFSLLERLQFCTVFFNTINCCMLYTVKQIPLT